MNFSCSTISRAIVKNNVEAFKELLNKRKRIDIPDNLGYTSLHIAVKKSATLDPYILDTLLEHPDVEINGRTVEGFTSLYIACNKRKPHLEVIKKLLAHGADPNISDMEQVAPMHVACRFGNAKLVKLLIKYKADINCRDFNSYTPLHYSIEYKKEDAIECLLLEKVDADIPDLHGLNALMFAIVTNWRFAFILANHTKHLNAKTNDNLTALQLAIRHDDYRTVKSLINCGADVYLGENTSEPLMQSLREHKFHMFRLFWVKLESKRLKKYDEIFRRVLIECNASADYRFLQIMTLDERLVCDIRDQKGVLAFIFYKGTNLNSQYTEEYFEDLTDVYESFFQCLIKQGIRMSSADVESFIFYFYTCPDRMKFLKWLLDATRPDITEHLVMYAFEYDLRMGALLLQHCPYVDPGNLYDYFRHVSCSHVWDVVEYVLKYFTPSKTHRVKMIERLVITNDEPQRLSVYRSLDDRSVKSLREMARDVVREQFQEVCETSSEFLDRVQELEVPTVVKDYITLKLPVRKA